MDDKAVRDLIACMQQVKDPREPNIRHRLSDILVIAILAMICGANTAVEMGTGHTHMAIQTYPYFA